jgi:putative transposase
LLRKRQINNEVVKRRVIDIFHYHKRRYGAVRICRELFKEYGFKVSTKKINSIMKTNSLVSLHTKRFRVITTDSKHKQPVSENLLNQNF